MTKKIALAVIHGIGTQEPGYSRAFTDALRLELSRRGGPELVSEEVCWQGVVQPGETGLVARSRTRGWAWARELFVNYAGDALAYQPSDIENNAYFGINEAVDRALRTLIRRAGDETPLVVLGHSLGSIVASSFLWDASHESSSGRLVYRPSFQACHAFDRVRLLVTAGSPLAVWSLRYPGGGDPLVLAKGAKWLNVYSPNDVIGYPLRPINARYAAHPQIEDVAMPVGGLLARLTPACHGAYLEDRGFVQRLAREILGL